MTRPVSTDAVRTDRCVIVVAKQPVTGTVKTRLCPPLSSDDAADLAEAFLIDTVSQVSECSAVTSVGYSPDAAKPWFEARFPDCLLLPQGEGDLGERMICLADQAWAKGFGSIALIGTDMPRMSAERLEQAFRAVENGVDFAIGPAEDGGYYLIAMQQPQEALFTGMPWGENEVLEETLRRARRAGLTVELLPQERDIDTPEDLAWLMERADADLGSATSDVLNRLRKTYPPASSSVWRSMRG